jgi:hypothetical membrane protein
MSRTSRRDPSAAIAAIMVAIPVVHVFSVIIASMNTPGYVTRLEPISNLALSSSPYRYLAIWGGLIVPGAALAGVSAWVIRSHLFGRRGEAGLALAAVCGLGMVLCGAFNYHSPVHIISVVASACLSAPAIVLIALNHPAWSDRPAYKALFCLWALFPVADVFGTIYALRHGRFLHHYVGLQQRISVGVTLCLFSIMILAAMYWSRHNNRVNLTDSPTTTGAAPEI